MNTEMSYTYADRKKAEPAARQPETAAQPSLDALRSGAARPSAEQRGRRVDLPDAMREKMETAFGADLSAVKLYESEAVADAGAKAVTQGSSIAFAPGMLDFTSYGGQALLGHEISHVVTQARGEVTGSGYLNDHALEARADREGALAAAGQSIAMPTAALSPVSAASADGPMQAARSKKGALPPKPDRPAPPPPAPPAPVSPLKAPKQDYSVPAGQFKTLKTGDSLKGRGGGKATSVMGVDTVEGGEAVVKFGANPLMEEASADMINVVGQTMHDMYGGSWDMDAPSARSPLPAEVPEVEDAIKSGEAQGFDAGQYEPGSTEAQKQEMELANTTVFSRVKGRNRREDHWDQKGIDADIARGLTPLNATEAPTNPTEKADYFRTMGHVAMTDVLLGNEDRMIKDLNFENWLEDTDARQVHLIDNDGAKRDYSMYHVADPRAKDYWLKMMLRFVGNSGDVDKGAEQLFRKVQNSADLSEYYTGEETKEGIAQVARALPQMREKLQAQYMAKNTGGPMTAYQQEALDRMEITHETMTDPKLAQVYKELSTVGMTSYASDTQETVDKRAGLLKERDRLRRIKKLKDRGEVDLSMD